MGWCSKARPAWPTAFEAAISESGNVRSPAHACAGRPVFAAGAAVVAGLAATLRRKRIPGKDRLRTEMEIHGTTAIASFRRIDATTILLNPAQLVMIVWALIAAARG